MQILVNTDHNVEGHAEFARRIEADVSTVLSRFSGELTRVEVHLSDENGAKSSGADKRCVMEARPEGHQPVSVTHEAATLKDAYDGAAKKLLRLLKSTLGRLHDRKGRASIRTENAVE